MTTALAPGAIRERPIIFNGPMIRAILEGRKTQTRRVINGRQPGPMSYLGYTVMEDGDALLNGPDYPDDDRDLVRNPYGVPGDRLWVRETFSFSDVSNTRVQYRASTENSTAGGWRPSIHMPRCASRIMLEIHDVRVERVQEISESDAIAEGSGGCRCGPKALLGVRFCSRCGLRPGSEHFAYLWDSINAKRGYGWARNPWVWVIAFRRVR